MGESRRRRRRKVDIEGYSLHPSSLSHFVVWMPNGPQDAHLTIQSMHAIADSPVGGLAAPNRMTESFDELEIALSKDDMAAVMEYFEGPLVGMGISGHNHFTPVSVNDPAECAEACTQT